MRRKAPGIFIKGIAWSPKKGIKKAPPALAKIKNIKR